MSGQSLGANQKFPKYRIPVRILFADQPTIIGTVFVRQDQRVLDLLCDERPFLPVATKSGTILINKAHIRQVNVLSLTEITEIKDLLPEFDADYLKKNSW